MCSIFVSSLPNGPSSGIESNLTRSHPTLGPQVVDYARMSDRTKRQTVPLDVTCSEELETRMIVDCSRFCGRYSQDGGEPI